MSSGSQNLCINFISQHPLYPKLVEIQPPFHTYGVVKNMAPIWKRKCLIPQICQHNTPVVRLLQVFCFKKIHEHLNPKLKNPDPVPFSHLKTHQFRTIVFLCGNFILQLPLYPKLVEIQAPFHTHGVIDTMALMWKRKCLILQMCQHDTTLMRILLVFYFRKIHWPQNPKLKNLDPVPFSCLKIHQLRTKYLYVFIYLTASFIL